MTAAQSFKTDELLNARFQQPERARALTEAIEAVVDEKVAEGNKNYEVLLHKDPEILRKEMDSRASTFDSRINLLDNKIDVKVAKLKSGLTKTIYIVGFSQFLAIVGSILAIVLLFVRK